MILYDETVTLYRVIKSINTFNPTYMRRYVIHRFRNDYYVTALVCRLQIAVATVILMT